MTKKLKNKEYNSKEEFLNDLELIHSNCFTYNNDETSAIRKNSSLLREKWLLLMQRVPDISVTSTSAMRGIPKEESGSYDLDEQYTIPSDGIISSSSISLSNYLGSVPPTPPPTQSLKSSRSQILHTPPSSGTRILEKFNHRDEFLMVQAYHLMRRPNYPPELDFLFLFNSLPDKHTAHQPHQGVIRKTFFRSSQKGREYLESIDTLFSIKGEARRRDFSVDYINLEKIVILELFQQGFTGIQVLIISQ